MHQYSVLASNPQSRVLALRDELGRCHLGRAAANAPSSGVVLVGDPPALGLRELRQAVVEEPCPVVLVLIDCEPRAALMLVETNPT